MKPIIGLTASTLNSLLPKLDKGNSKQQKEYQLLIGNSESIKAMYSFNQSVQMVFENDLRAIENAGGIPLIIPATEDVENLDTILRVIDGVLITGGYDIEPIHYNEKDSYSKGLLGDIESLADDDAALFAKFSKKRDVTELELVRKAYKLKTPIMGICRGTQVINVAMGGNVYQDILLQNASINNHADIKKWNAVAHDILIDKDSHLYNILKTGRFGVNSIHHQAVKDIGKNLRVVAWAEDGIIECIESIGDDFLMGVQWHPEMMQHDDVQQSIIRYFIEQCRNENN